MTAPQITTLPPEPQRIDSPADFTVKADAWVAALGVFTGEANTQADFNNATASATEASSVTSAGFAADSAASASQSASSATLSASSAGFEGLWSSLTGAASIPFSVYHVDEFWQLINNLADITLSEPNVSGDWVRIEMDKSADYSQTGAILVKSVWMANPTTATVTRLTPASPANDQEFTVKDDAETASGTNKIVIQYDSVNTIMGLAEDLEITSAKQFVTLKFRASTSDWRVVG